MISASLLVHAYWDWRQTAACIRLPDARSLRAELTVHGLGES